MDVTGQEVASHIRGLAGDLDGLVSRSGAVPDLPEVVTQLRRFADAAERGPGDRHARYIALRARDLAARLDTTFHRAKIAALGGRLFDAAANQHHVALAAVAQGPFGPGEGLDEASAEAVDDRNRGGHPANGPGQEAPRTASASFPIPPRPGTRHPGATTAHRTTGAYPQIGPTTNQRRSQ